MLGEKRFLSPPESFNERSLNLLVPQPDKQQQPTGGKVNVQIPHSESMGINMRFTFNDDEDEEMFGVDPRTLLVASEKMDNSQEGIAKSVNDDIQIDDSPHQGDMVGHEFNTVNEALSEPELENPEKPEGPGNKKAKGDRKGKAKEPPSGPLEPCNQNSKRPCFRKCTLNYSEADRQKMFETFQKFNCHQRGDFFHRYTHTHKVANPHRKKKTSRQWNTYYLPGVNTNSIFVRHHLC